MQHLVSPLQAAFTPGRKGLDNMIIAQEILHSMDKKKGWYGTMALKIDLEKAFDRLEWSFIREVLVLFNFPLNLISIIMDCISSTSISAFFNGGKLPAFSPSHGIRQRDPLSPYIFILCLEYFRILIRDKTANNTWKPVKAYRSGPTLSRLFFVDDLMLFGQASLENSEAINEVLTIFCQLSRQRVSKEKSRVLFSKNTPEKTRSNICCSLGILETRKFDKYLGFR